MSALISIQLAGRLVGSAMRRTRWKQLIGIITRGFVMKQEAPLSDLVADYDVVIMKHCYTASDVLEDVGIPDPSSPRKSLENYKAVYRLLRNEFDKHSDTLFILWTLPPRHRLFEPSDGDKDTNAARATEFSNWLKTYFLTEGGDHSNIYILNFRDIVVDPNNNFLKYEYESNHNTSDSHPKKLANNNAGTQFAKFIVDSIANFYGSSKAGKGAKIVFLHHSTGLNVYQYPDLGVPAWFKEYNASKGTNYVISHKWYPWDGNMPVHYYCRWLAKTMLGDSRI